MKVYTGPYATRCWFGSQGSLGAGTSLCPGPEALRTRRSSDRVSFASTPRSMAAQSHPSCCPLIC